MKRQAGRRREPGQPRRQRRTGREPLPHRSRRHPPGGGAPPAGHPSATTRARAPFVPHERAQQCREEAPEDDLAAQPRRREVHDGARRLERGGEVEDEPRTGRSTAPRAQRGAGTVTADRGSWRHPPQGRPPARHQLSRAWSRVWSGPRPPGGAPRRATGIAISAGEKRPHRRLRQDREDYERPVARLHAGARVRSGRA